jgi:hypothetical protein
VLARIIHDDSSRNRAVAKRDGRVEPREADAYLKQYVEATWGEPAQPTDFSLPLSACRSGESAIVVEALMNNAG